MLLASDVILAGFALSVEGVELLFEPLIRRLAGIDGAAGLLAADEISRAPRELTYATNHEPPLLPRPSAQSTNSSPVAAYASDASTHCDWTPARPPSKSDLPRSGVAVAVARPFRQPEESRPGPLGAGNVARDLGQRSVGLALEFEADVGDADRVGSPMPFANEARAGFDLGSWRRRNRSARFELRGQGH